MEKPEYYNPDRIIFGPGERMRTGQELARLGRRRVLLLVGKGPFRENGLHDEIAGRIKAIVDRNGRDRGHRLHSPHRQRAGGGGGHGHRRQPLGRGIGNLVPLSEDGAVAILRASCCPL